MARRALTDRAVKALKAAPPGERIDYMDAVVPGLGVRVTDRADQKGRAVQRTFILRMRYPGARNPTRRALGEYGCLTLGSARAKARQWINLVQQGIDPSEYEKAGRLAERNSRANTFGAVAEDFIHQHLRHQRRSVPSEREIRKELISRWQDRPISSVSRQDLVELVDTIKRRGALRQAHNILGHARAIYNWAIDRGIYGLDPGQSPFNRLRPTRLIGPKKIRKRVLSDQELGLIWKAAERIGYPYGPLLRLLLLTGQRKAEVAEMEWKEVDFDARVWTIPPERFKSDETHLVPLCDEAFTLLKGLPRFDHGDFVFSTTFGSVPVNGFSKMKARLDATIGTDLPPWVLHDLRRTVRTRLSSLRVEDHVAEMVIGHGRRGNQRIYDQHKYGREIREALSKWEVELKERVVRS